MAAGDAFSEHVLGDQTRTEGLGSISPLLGTQRAQAAVDTLARTVERLESSLSKTVAALNKVENHVSGMSGTGTQSGGSPNGGSNNGTGNPSTQSGGKANGGGWSNMSWGQRAGRAGIAAAGALEAYSIAAGPSYVTSATTAQMLARTSNSSWQSVGAGFLRNNYTAMSDADAAAGAVAQSRLGYAARSPMWNRLENQNKMAGLIDPTLGYGQMGTAGANLGTANAYNFFAARGIRTVNGGQTMTPLDMASQLNRSILGNRTSMTKDQAAFYMGQNGQGGLALQSMVNQGVISSQDAQVYQSFMRSQATAMSKGYTIDDFNKAYNAGDQKALAKMGIDETSATTLKKTQAGLRNSESNLLGGFDEGLKTASGAVQGFASALDTVTKQIGGLLGFGVGAGAALGLGGGVATGALGLLGKGAIAKKLLGAGGRAASTSAVRGGLSSMWDTARLNAMGAGTGASMGEVAAIAAPVAAVAAIGYGAVHATTDHKERAARDAAYRRHHQKQHWWNNSWEDSFNSALTFGLTDKAQNWLHPNSGSAGWNSTGNDGISGGATGGSGGGGATGASAATGGSNATAAQAISIAKKYLGVPYQWGGTSPKGFDCSGLMQYVFKSLGVTLPRTSQEQARVGSPVAIKDVRPGDLVFPSGAAHVAMVIGPGQILEAPHTGANVRIASLRSEFAFGRRVLSKVGDVGAVTGDSSNSVSGDNRKQGTMPAIGGNSGTSELDVLTSALSGYGAASLNNPTNSNADSNSSASANGSGGPTGPMPTGNVASWIKSALGIMHLDYGKYGSALATIIQHESGGNPRAINKTDSNWKAGHPSKGLMQTIDSTFAAHALPGHGDIWNPIDNIIAATRYAMSRYGSIDNVPGIKSLNNGGGYKGYAVGSTNIDVDQVARVHKGEMIIDAANAEEIRKALANNTPTASKSGKGRGGVTVSIGQITLHASGPMNDSAATDFSKKVVSMIANSNELQTIAQGV